MPDKIKAKEKRVLEYLYTNYPDYVEIAELKDKVHKDDLEKVLAYLLEKGYIAVRDLTTNGEWFGKVKITAAGIDYLDILRKQVRAWQL